MITKTIRGILICGVLLLGTGPLHASVLSGAESVSKVVKSKKNSVVSLLIRSIPAARLSAPYFPFRQGFQFFVVPEMVRPKKHSEGSGVIYDRSGLILTNAHVVSNADEILVTLADGRKYSARVKNTNPSFDLAVVEIDDPSFSGTLEPDFVSQFGDSDKLEVGDVVVAIGSPYSLDGTVTAGIVSAKGRTLKGGAFGQYSNLIQTDASINPGNSGGPLLNLKGEVVGINTAMSRGGQGIGFSIPINLAKRMTSDVKRFGKVKQSWLGVMVQDVDLNTAPYLGLDTPRGVLVQKVLQGTPAEDAGLRRGDVILELQGQKVDNKDVLIERIQEIPVHEEVELEIIREKNPLSLRVRIGERSASKSGLEPSKRSRQLAGLHVEPLGESRRRELGVSKKARGLFVVEVVRGSSMDRAGVKPRDILVQVNGRAMASQQDLRLVEGAVRSNRALELLLVREGQMIFVEVKNERG